jgi:uncharacterized repeat protein (TIGR03843 family)
VSEDERPPGADALTALLHGDVELEGRLPWSSNATFVVSVCCDGVSSRAVYKPGRGERELWDFPGGLYRREVAAYALSEALGWGIVPETVVRADGPFGPGSYQRFVEADFSQHYFTLVEDERNHDALRAIAVFDLLANNTDRKSGHCIVDGDGRIWGIDHGLCFHEDPKLRTVIWDFAGERIDAELLRDVERVARSLPVELNELLDGSERAALSRRAAAVARGGRFPDPDPASRPYPWPLV